MRTALIAIIFSSAAINGFLFWLIYVYSGTAGTAHNADWIPAMNAGWNALSASFVLAGLWFVRQGRYREHGTMLICAMFASVAFLIGYIVYHTLHGDVRFLTQGWIRPVYFFILITHIVLSVAVLPLVLTTVALATMRQWNKHRAIARWTYPIWLYVSFTGIAVFLFLRFLNTAPHG